MTLDVIRKFELGNTVYFRVYFRNQVSELVDPSDPTYQIINIRGEIVASGTPSKLATGHYYSFYTPTEEGDFILKFQGKITGHVTVIRKKFKIVRTTLKGEFSSSSSSFSSSSSSFSSSSFSSSSFSSCSSSLSSSSSSSSSYSSSSSCSSSSSSSG